MSRRQTIGASSPYLDEMMVINLRQFQIPRFPNDKRFQTKLCAEVVNSVSKLCVTQKDGVWLVGYFVPLPLPYDEQRWSQRDSCLTKYAPGLRAPSNPGKFRVFCALVPSLVVEHGS